MLEFTYQTNDTEGQRTQKISIPLLTLVPLPLLQVQEADFEFDIQIVDALQADRNSTFSLHDPEKNNESTESNETKTMITPKVMTTATPVRLQYPKCHK